MTNAQIKAKQLVDTYLRLEDDTSFYWNCYWDERMNDNEVLPHAKKCALKTVLEMKKLIAGCEFLAMERFLDEVMQEIEKL